MAASNAVVIRTFLLPAVLELPGRRTWAFPRWFDRRLTRLAIERRPAHDTTSVLEEAACWIAGRSSLTR